MPPALLGLRHPGPQHEVRIQPPQWVHGGSSSSSKQEELVVAALLRELSTARQQRAAAEGQLAALKDDFLAALRSRESTCAKPSRKGSSSSSGEEQAGVGKAPPVQSKAGRTGGKAMSQQLHAFRTPGKADAECRRGQHSAKQPEQRGRPCAAPPTSWQGQQQKEQAHDPDLRLQLDVLRLHCERLQQQLEESSPPRRPSSPAVRSCPQQPAPPRSLSPGRTTVVVSSSPRQQCPVTDRTADLAVAIFEPAQEGAEAAGMRLELARLRRDNVRLGSRLREAQEGLVDSEVQARRWQEAVEQQAGAIGQLRVDVEAERRAGAALAQCLQASGQEVQSAQADAAALLARLRAAQEEAEGLRGRASEGERTARELQGALQALGAERDGLAARLEASELVRHVAEREQREAQQQAQSLEAALAQACSAGEGREAEAERMLGACHQQLAVERQRVELLQAQLELVEQQAAQNEHLLSGQLRAVHDERNACLSAATRADALLVKLGQHALLVKSRMIV